MPLSVRILALLATLALVGAAAPAARADTAFDERAECSKLGPKPPGSAAGRAQASRIATAFRAAGLSTSFEDFHVPTYVVDHVDLAVTGSGARDVPGETFS